ncbi:hypothetical protein EVAR_28938_1 [Eumeta japonica]|uniref:Uncharacterized protein n=1 Tax=Eumeta variegata TaxID=151549 RepID=A0A4C1VY94_EUMVA|nr:hypothetical protein EVAR_28938_1 [Eumeta japonica]
MLPPINPRAGPFLHKSRRTFLSSSQQIVGFRRAPQSIEVAPPWLPTVRDVAQHNIEVPGSIPITGVLSQRVFNLREINSLAPCRASESTSSRVSPGLFIAHGDEGRYQPPPPHHSLLQRGGIEV